MEEMKCDMCGGAAVMCAGGAVALEKPDVGVVAIVPATDNMSGSRAIHPGDIITHYNGVTSEVINTDAEGRLILADALAWGIETFEPTCVLDAATLTGAVIIGLGRIIIQGLCPTMTPWSKRLRQPGIWPENRSGACPFYRTMKNRLNPRWRTLKTPGGNRPAP